MLGAVTFQWGEASMIRNEWKLIVAFVAGMVLSFLAGLYLLGPLFAGRQEARMPEASPSETKEEQRLTLAESVPNSIFRRDTTSVPDHTTVVVERVNRPVEEQPTFSAPVEEPAPFPQELTPPPPPVRTPRPARPEPGQQPPTPSEGVTTQPPATTETEPITPPLPMPETKRSYRVRTGVFQEEQFANRMVEALTAQGYHPFVEEEVVGGQKRYRIYVGAFDNRESAERLKQELAQKGIHAVVEEKQE